MQMVSARGHGLLKGGRRFGSVPKFLAHLLSPGMSRLIQNIDKGLIFGKISALLPDGSSVTLGGRASGFAAEVTLHEWRGLLRVATGGSVGLYQAWEAGEWSSPDPVQLFALFTANAADLGDIARAKGPWRFAGRVLHALKRNTKDQAEKNIHLHYDLGNDFYSAWLDPSMTYSSAYRFGADGLSTAQYRKWERLAERLGTPQKLLEIGCGWGSLAAYLAEQGSQTTAISLSDRQLDWAREHFPAVTFVKQDYRDTSGQFDAIVSVEMVEALGREYWPAFLDCIARNLKPGGKAALQFIAMREDLYDSYARNPDFIQAYIFPGGVLIRTSEFRRLAEERGLAWTEQEDFGLDYAETLREWRERFENAVADGRLPRDFDKHFCDLWRFYLMYCEGGFRGGGITVSQVTLVKN